MCVIRLTGVYGGERAGGVPKQVPLGVIACCSPVLLTCALLITANHFHFQGLMLNAACDKVRPRRTKEWTNLNTCGSDPFKNGCNGSVHVPGSCMYDCQWCIYCRRCDVMGGTTARMRCDHATLCTLPSLSRCDVMGGTTARMRCDHAALCTPPSLTM